MKLTADDHIARIQTQIQRAEKLAGALNGQIAVLHASLADAAAFYANQTNSGGPIIAAAVAPKN